VDWLAAENYLTSVGRQATEQRACQLELARAEDGPAD